WYDVLEGTDPGFLYQQNTMRDAIVAAINLNIFNSHSDRVIMANLAQAVNVLQSVILTEGKYLVKTPTYYVMKLYKGHQQGELIYSHIENETVGGVPALTQSVSVRDDAMTITIANCSLDESYEIDTDISGFCANKATGEIVTADVHAYNDFNKEEQVTAKPFDVKLSRGKVSFTLPPCSAAAVTLR
ncbi:MAG: alpha-N-arabinofuranosidase, partial [Ruminococcus sp.]|nr:alpha-N-arabinofuranosidase [Ruminococcus sp.]